MVDTLTSMKKTLLSLFLFSPLAISGYINGEEKYDTIGSLESHDPRFNKLVLPSAKIEIIAKDFSWIEGQVHPSGGRLRGNNF